jgi:hypothetical protein
MQRPKMLVAYESDFSPIAARSLRSRFDGSEFSDMSAKRADKKKARQERRDERKIAKAKVKGEKERANLGLSNDDLMTVAGQGAAGGSGGSSNTMYYIAAAVAVVIVLIVVMIKKR